MMNENDMNELLAGIIARYSSTFGKAATKKAVKKLKTESVTKEIDLNTPMSFGEIVAVVQTCGRVVESDEFQGTIGAIVMSGFGGMNPAVLAIRVVNQRIYMRAYAKEGLIKQHTAEKAIKLLADIFAKEQ